MPTMPKNILKLCFTALLFVSSFPVSAQHYNLPSEAEVFDYWRETMRVGRNKPEEYYMPNNEADVGLLYDEAVKSNPDALFSLGYFFQYVANEYKGLYFLKQATEKGSEKALRHIPAILADDEKSYTEDWFQLALTSRQEYIDESDGYLSTLSLELACQYFIPDPEGYLGPYYYFENKRELSKLNTGRHGCEPYDKNIRDYAKARHYFLKVIDFSLPNNNARDVDIYRATQALGVIYRDGLGVPTDKAMATMYFMSTREAE